MLRGTRSVFIVSYYFSQFCETKRIKLCCEAKLKMTKIGIITTYQRILYSSAVKKDVFKTTRPYSSTSNSNSSRENEKNDIKEKENLQKFREENNQKFNLRTGDIGHKVELVKVNLEDARKLALVQYENQKKLLEEKLESLKAIFGTGGLQPRTPDEEWYHKRVISI